jgi:histidine ammonia-lyase
MPQVHGAARDAFSYARRVLEIEINSATDNPLVFPETGEIVSGGNFHAQIVGQVLDLLAIAAADVAAISERRIERMLNPDSSGLPAFLAKQPGVESGLMMLQTAVADVLTELRILATPASVHSVPTGANREDHVAMGPAAARKAARVSWALSYVAAVELICAAQAIEHHRPLTSSPRLETALALVRRQAPALDHDRPLTADVEAVAAAVRAGTMVA